jgi:hypothetical protein
MRRRRALKQIAMHVPMRPLLRFLYVLVIKRGMLDGRAGWEYARMMRVFQDMIDLALIEARNQEYRSRAPRIHAETRTAESKR